MKRIDKIYRRVSLHHFREVSPDQLLQMQGLSAKDIAQELQMERSNVSFELNNLVRAKRAIKVKTFPVRYVPVEVVERTFNIKWNTAKMEVDGLHQCSGNQKRVPRKISTNPLELMIGAKAP